MTHTNLTSLQLNKYTFSHWAYFYWKMHLGLNHLELEVQEEDRRR